MYCKECGQSIENKNAVICVKCGTKVGVGNNFCQCCGKEIVNKDSEFCINCGSALRVNHEIMSASNGNSKVIASLLTFLLGYTGIHRFYLGYREVGFIQLSIFLVALFVYEDIIIIPIIWSVIDLVLILTGKLNNSKGEKLV